MWRGQQGKTPAAETDPALSSGSLRQGGLRGTEGRGDNTAREGKRKNKKLKKKCKHTVVPEQFWGQGAKIRVKPFATERSHSQFVSTRRMEGGTAQPVTYSGGGWGQGMCQQEPRFSAPL